MILKIAWRNIWRHPLRTIILSGAICIGVWAGLAVHAFYAGVINKRVDDVIRSELSHVQIHHPKFEADMETNHFIAHADEVINSIHTLFPKAIVAPRQVVNGMINSANNGKGIQIRGIDPGKEDALRNLSSQVIEGEFPTDNGIMIGQKLAKELKIELGSTPVITMKDKDNQILSFAISVNAIYKSHNAMLDEVLINMRGQDLGKYIGTTDPQEIAVLFHTNDSTEIFKQELQAALPNLKVQSWTEISPEMKYIVSSTDQVIGIIVWIIMFALIFGIVNTMLMAVLERTRELAMLKAIGMNKWKLFVMILYETFFNSIMGTIAGLAIGLVTISYFHNHGIDLSEWGEVMEEFGYSAIVYPEISGQAIFNTCRNIFILSIIAALYPAKKVIDIEIVKTISKK